MNTVKCQHVDEGDRPAVFWLPIGDQRELALCSECFGYIRMQMLMTIIVDGVREGVYSGIREWYLEHGELL